MIGEWFEVDGNWLLIDLYEGGYLFFVMLVGDVMLCENYVLQISFGVDIWLMDGDVLCVKFLWLNVDDFVLGVYGVSGEGWFDGYGFVQVLCKKVQVFGVCYVLVDVKDVVCDGCKIMYVVMDDGECYVCDMFVNVVGVWMCMLLLMMGIDILVFVWCCSIFNVLLLVKFVDCLLLIDLIGVYFWLEGCMYICGMLLSFDCDLDDLLFDEVDYDLFDDVIWLMFVYCVLEFEVLCVENCWFGYYEYNVFDYNVIIGYYLEFDNVVFVNGYSGYGLQQGFVMGCGVSEFILGGCYDMFDLLLFGWVCVFENWLIVEKNVVQCGVIVWYGVGGIFLVF